MSNFRYKKKSAMAEITKKELFDLIDAYARQKALHSFLEASRVATTKTDRGPARSEVRALDSENIASI
jgi:hypothetical protein